MNIILTGMRGTGKSVIGKKLAKLLCMEFIDLDVEIEILEGRLISDIIKHHSWDYFRNIEHKLVRKFLTDTDKYVIATGGGAPTQSNNAEYFKISNNIIVLLEANIEVLTARIKHSIEKDSNEDSFHEKRPPLTDSKNLYEEMKIIWKEREEKYRKLAEITYDVSFESDNQDLDFSNKCLDIATAVLHHSYPEHELLATIGNPVCKSKSPIIHNTGIVKLELDAHFTLLNISIDKSLGHLKSLGFSGFSVTTPFKEEIIPLLDSISDEVEQIGACNTVHLKNGKWYGFNTDYIGVTDAIRELIKTHDNTSPEGKKVVLVGAGGAAKAIAYALHKLSCDVVIVNRTLEKAEKIAHQYGFQVVQTDKFKTLDYDLLINATSVDKPIDLSKLKEKMAVLDINYMNESRLLLAAQEKQCTVANGVHMLLYQGAAQFKIWFGKELPVQLVKEKLGQ